MRLPVDCLPSDVLVVVAVGRGGVVHAAGHRDRIIDQPPGGGPVADNAKSKTLPILRAGKGANGDRLMVALDPARGWGYLTPDVIF